jgi:hypothetical protein
MRQWWSKVARALGRRRNLANELQEELDAHLQFLIRPLLGTSNSLFFRVRF